MRRCEQRFAHAEHTVERRADFVAHVGEELALGAGACLSRRLGGREFRFGVHARVLHAIRGKSTDEREQHTGDGAHAHDAVEASNPIVVTLNTERDPDKARHATVFGEDRRIGAHASGPVRRARHRLHEHRVIGPQTAQLRRRHIHTAEFDVFLYATRREFAARGGIEDKANGVAYNDARDDALDRRVAVQ